MIGQRLLVALKRTILLCASVHLVLLGVLAVVRHQPNLINLFSILDLKLIWPRFGTGGTYLLLGSLLGLAIYLAMFLAASDRSGKPPR